MEFLRAAVVDVVVLVGVGVVVGVGVGVDGAGAGAGVADIAESVAALVVVVDDFGDIDFAVA